MIRDMRPKNAVLLMMFSSIHVDTDPHRIKVRFCFLLKCKSHRFFSFGMKDGSPEAIHDISSSNITVGLSVIICNRYENASSQSVQANCGSLLYDASVRANVSRCV